MWLFLGLLVTCCFCLTSLLLVNWDTPEDRTLYSTVSVGIGGVLLGALVQHYSRLTLNTAVAMTIALVVVLTAVVWWGSAWKNRRPVNVTETVRLDETNERLTTRPGTTFTITVALPQARRILDLRLGAVDLDGHTGEDCVLTAELRLSGAGLGAGGVRVPIADEVRIPIGDRRNRVVLEAEIDSNPACRIRIAPAHAVIHG
ncbi:hypothetical protein [Streptomyces sp. SID3212]|uniref:hypothetical protein n=1 Tax=Streptomyces sp. SID3212 TaxID=2690259 RepID=UPI00136F57D2|nr:hypothetical protein [Streptomyces sp. SID3212]MYV56637.1 hypothetical protein [Streptomyces sp. SID3212]